MHGQTTLTFSSQRPGRSFKTRIWWAADIFAPGVEKQACELETSVSVVPSLRMRENMSSRPSSTPLPVLYVTVTNRNVVDIMQLVSSSL